MEARQDLHSWNPTRPSSPVTNTTELGQMAETPNNPMVPSPSQQFHVLSLLPPQCQHSVSPELFSLP